MDLIIKKNRKNVGENIVDSKYAKSYKVLKALCTLSHEIYSLTLMRDLFLTALLLSSHTVCHQVLGGAVCTSLVPYGYFQAILLSSPLKTSTSFNICHHYLNFCHLLTTPYSKFRAEKKKGKGAYCQINEQMLEGW